MRVMALDIGEVRVGVAVSDPGERVASPVCVMPAAEVTGCAKPFRRLLEDWEDRKSTRLNSSHPK